MLVRARQLRFDFDGVPISSDLPTRATGRLGTHPIHANACQARSVSPGKSALLI